MIILVYIPIYDKICRFYGRKWKNQQIDQNNVRYNGKFFIKEQMWNKTKLRVLLQSTGQYWHMNVNVGQSQQKWRLNTSYQY